MNHLTETKPDFFRIIHERRAVKNYDVNYQMSEEEIRYLLRTASTAPSAWNLQHWKFVVIKDQVQKDILFGIADNQKQILEASIVVVVLGDLQADRNAGKVLELDIKAGRMTSEIKSNLISQIEGAYAANPVWARDQAFSNASLAAMQLLLVAKAMGLDSCPMGGFDPIKLVNAFAIPDRYVPVMLITVGKAVEPAARPSERLPISETIL